MSNLSNHRYVLQDPPVDHDFFRSQSDNKLPDNGLDDETVDAGRAGSTQIGGARTSAIPKATGPSVSDASLNLGTGVTMGQLMRNGSPIDYYHGGCRLPSNSGAVDNTVFIATLTDSGGMLACNHRISISYGQSGHSTAKNYIMSWQYNQYPTGVVVQPITDTGGLGVAATGSNFELIAKVGTNKVDYYIRRTFGTDQAGGNRIPMAIHIESHTDYAETLNIPCETITDNTVYPFLPVTTPPITCLVEQKIVVANSANTSSTILATTEICYVQMGTAALYTLTLPAGSCTRPRIIVKRVDANTNSTLRVQSTSGIDGAPSNRISLGSSNAFGIISGESVILQWSTTDSTWRVI